MTQDNKDAALELAKKFYIIPEHDSGYYEYAAVQLDDAISFYDAARKPMEELLQKLSWAEAEAMALVLSHESVIERLQQQLLATQGALGLSRPFVVREINAAVSNNFGYADDWANKCIEVRDTIDKALSNPPSLEDLEQDREKRKLKDEIDVLDDVAVWGEGAIPRIIAERKAKLENMK